MPTIADYTEAIAALADGMHSVDTGDVFCKFTCGELQPLVDVLRLGGQERAANFVLHEHAVGDDDPGDEHHELGLSLAGKDCPDCGFTHYHDHD